MACRRTSRSAGRRLASTLPGSPTMAEFCQKVSRSSTAFLPDLLPIAILHTNSSAYPSTCLNTTHPYLLSTRTPDPSRTSPFKLLGPLHTPFLHRQHPRKDRTPIVAHLTLRLNFVLPFPTRLHSHRRRPYDHLHTPSFWKAFAPSPRKSPSCCDSWPTRIRPFGTCGTSSSSCQIGRSAALHSGGMEGDAARRGRRRNGLPYAI